MESNHFIQNIAAAHKDALTSSSKTHSLGVLFLCIGVAAAAVVASLFIEDHTSGLYMFLMLTAFIALLIAALRYFSGGKVYVVTDTRSRIHTYLAYLEPSDLQSVQTLFERGQFETLPRLKKTASTALRLDVAISDDKRFAAAQLFRYIPHNYEAASSVYRLNSDQVGAFCTYFEQCPTVRKVK